MSKQWKALEEGLQSTEDEDILRALQGLEGKCRDNSPLDQDASTLLLQVIDKLQHHDITVRCLAISIIASQLRANNWALERLMPELAKKLAQPNILDLKASKKSGQPYKKLHKEVVFALTELHNRHPSKLMPVFRPVVNYMVECTGSKHREISTPACQFWGNIKSPPVLQKAMGDWLPPVFQKLGKLVQHLLHAMIYHEDYVQYLESQVCAGGRPRTKSLEYESLSDLRNYAALGFEKLCAIFTSEVTPIFKLYVQKWLGSRDWLEQEAIALALGAYCQAMQDPRELKELLPEVMSQLLGFLQSNRPLLRAIACFTLVHFMNVRVKGVKDPCGRMLRGTIQLVTDDHVEVQDQALRCMATLMAYGERDLSSHSRKIVHALVGANDSAVGKSRHAYYECIGHTFGRLASMLDERDIHALIAPLMEHWGMLQWLQAEHAPAEDISALCSPLCVVAMFGKSDFAQYNEQILDKVVPYLERLTGSPNGHGDTQSHAITAHVVGYLDLISAMYEGQGSRLNKTAGKCNLSQAVLGLLNNADKFKDEVTQSSLALLGHICKHSFEDVRPYLDDIFDAITTHVDSKSDNIRSNALWALTQIVRTCDEKNNKMFLLASDLTDLILNLRGQENVIVYSALSLTMMASKWSTMVKVLMKEEVFVHLCALLQTAFSEESDKYEIFHHLCTVVTTHMNKVPKDAWIHFCAASATLEAPNEQLRDEIKNILKNVRMTIGNAAWNKLNTSLGQKMAYNMRKKYKLY